MIRRHTCYIPDCDQPDCTKPFDDEGYTPHFDTAEEAAARLADEWGWTHTGGVLRCRDCTKRHQCEQTGHDWYDPSHGDPGFRAEYCRSCSATRPQPTLEDADPPAREKAPA
ncbi:hypothetical protein [Nocardiopsis synnemataformans]|uniref:hypothetical protein n=1 Tax=Nocardiopsis synnemataformans TaxID=61305 RepID=UPI003EB7FD20